MYLVALMTLLVLLVLFFSRRYRRRSPALVTLTAYEGIRSLLDPPAASTSTLLYRRAAANAHLIRTFGIHNSAFTSPSISVHHSFNKDARARLRDMDSTTRWQESKGVTQDAVEFYLPHGNKSGDYATFMQATTFIGVLSMLFDGSSVFPDAKDVRYVTEGINELWLTSKHPGSDSSRTSPILARINQHLQNWIPQDPADPFIENPLEIILPAYETLWRLVAYTFIHVERSRKHTLPFVEFFQNPTIAQFEFSRDLESPSARDIMQEALRLYPPTKRIKRTLAAKPPMTFSWAYQSILALIFFRPISAPSIVAADIEALQRSSVWDPLPHDFDAMRHKTSTEVQNQCFMPFGLGPLKCIAASWAPRFAGLLVASLAKRDDVKLVRGNAPGGRDDWKGWSICRRE